MPRSRALVTFSLLVLFALLSFTAISLGKDRRQIAPPLIGNVAPPSADATPQVLEQRGDELRREKLFLDALDYYRAALGKTPNSAPLYNKIGITEIQLQRWNDSKKDFEHAIKYDHEFADAYNNLGVIYYVMKKYGKAIGKYEKAIQLRSDSASYFSNMGAAYFSKKDFERSVMAYSHAMQLDPDIFEHSSRTGISAQMSGPEDRAHYDYVLAKLYAKMGVADRSLEYLRKAMEEGYKNIDNVYKDAEFTGVRKDPRFTALMSSKAPAISD